MSEETRQPLAVLLNSISRVGVTTLDATGQILSQFGIERTASTFQLNLEEINRLKVERKFPEDQVSLVVDTYRLHYLIMVADRQSKANTTLIFGPYLVERVTNQEPDMAVASDQLPMDEKSGIRRIYEAVPVLTIEQEQSYGRLMQTLVDRPLSPTLPLYEERPITVPIKLENQNLDLNSPAVIEARYHQQHQMVAEVSSGDLKVVRRHLERYSQTLDFFRDRIPNNPVRSMKNIMFTYNTLFRIGVEEVGGAAVLLHETSEKFAISIEQCRTIAALRRLSHTIAIEYCQLAQQLSQHQYSPAIQRTVSLIDRNLGHQITLTQIAEAVGTNASYLSRKFKAETGTTFQQYLIKHRIREAQKYLKETMLSITKIAYLCGFGDVTSLNRNFKKMVGMPPSQYRKSRQKHLLVPVYD